MDAHDKAPPPELPYCTGDSVARMALLHRWPDCTRCGRARLRATDRAAEYISDIADDFSAHADGDRRGLDRTRGQRRKKGLSGTRPRVLSHRHGSSAFAVGMLRDIEREKTHEDDGVVAELGLAPRIERRPLRLGRRAEELAPSARFFLKKVRRRRGAASLRVGAPRSAPRHRLAPD